MPRGLGREQRRVLALLAGEPEGMPVLLLSQSVQEHGMTVGYLLDQIMIHRKDDRGAWSKRQTMRAAVRGLRDRGLIGIERRYLYKPNDKGNPPIKFYQWARITRRGSAEAQRLALPASEDRGLLHRGRDSA